ncbi:MAG: homocysteine S-methyltransferase family protein [Pseudomonadota bacterium]
MTAIALLDGSIGQELVRRSGEPATPLWSTRVMMDKPDLVGDVHSEYYSSGATIATTNTYAVHRSRLDRVGLSDQIPHLLDCALTQAERARAKYPTARIAGALGPLLASYRPDLNPDVDEAAGKYRELVTAMSDRVDLFLIETVSSLQEAEGALRGTQGCGKPVWLALTVGDNDGTRLRSGEPVSAIADIVERYDPAAVLINCSPPEAVPAALEVIRSLNRPYGAYANGFTEISPGFLQDAPTVDALTRRQDLTPEAYADHAMGWIGQGATIVGGCCEVGPGHISELATRLTTAGYQIM